MLNHANSYNQYINQKMHSIKCNKIQFITSMKLLHIQALGAILKKSLRTKEYKFTTLIQVLIALTRMTKILNSMKLTSIKSQCCGTKNYVIVSRFQNALTAVYILSKLSTQTSDLIYVLKRDLIQMQHAKFIVSGSVGSQWTCIPLF